MLVPILGPPIMGSYHIGLLGNIREGKYWTSNCKDHKLKLWKKSILQFRLISLGSGSWLKDEEGLGIWSYWFGV